MRTLIAVIVVALWAGTTAEAQKQKKKPATRPRIAVPSSPTQTKSRIIGSTAVVITKNGDRISGEVLDLTVYSLRLRADSLESSIALDTIASLSFGGAPAASSRAEPQSAGVVRTEFARDAETVLGFFQTMTSSLKPGVDYTEYGRQLTELRRAGERFISKYSSTENPSEARVVSLVAGALTDYTWARSIWTLKFGRSSDGSVAETDSPVIADAVALYPDLRTMAASPGNKLSAEKLLLGIWRKASEKQDRARTLISSR